MLTLARVICKDGKLFEVYGHDDIRFETSDNVIIDHQTGLMWQRNPLEGSFTYNEATRITSNLEGYSDWRLPTIKELMSIIDFDIGKPACNEDFRQNNNHIFWSSTLRVGNAHGVWCVYFNYGVVDFVSRYNILSVRLVRGEKNV